MEIALCCVWLPCIVPHFKRSPETLLNQEHFFSLKDCISFQTSSGITATLHHSLQLFAAGRFTLIHISGISSIRRFTHRLCEGVVNLVDQHVA